MARTSPKPVRVIEIHPHKQRVELFLDRKTLRFYCELYGERLDAASAEQLEQVVRAKADASCRLEWFALISVERLAPFGTERGGAAWLGFGHDRFWVARAMDGSHLRAPWDDDDTDADRLEWASQWRHRRDETLVFPLVEAAYRASGGSVTYMRYTPELWAALGRLRDTVNNACAAFERLIDTAEGHAALTASGDAALRLLGAGSAS